MGLELCLECKKMHYTTNPCAQMIAKKSAANPPAKPNHIGTIGHVDHGKTSLTAAITKVLAELDPGEHTASAEASKPVRKDTRKGDRHSPGYWADYQRQRRAKLKEAGK